jgi:hypothetical protein
MPPTSDTGQGKKPRWLSLIEMADEQIKPTEGVFSSYMSWATEALFLARSSSAINASIIESEKAGNILPRDGAPNNALLKAVFAFNATRAAKLLCIIIFVREALARQLQRCARGHAKCVDFKV